MLLILLHIEIRNRLVKNIFERTGNSDLLKTFIFIVSQMCDDGSTILE